MPNYNPNIKSFEPALNGNKLIKLNDNEVEKQQSDKLANSKDIDRQLWLYTDNAGQVRRFLLKKKTSSNEEDVKNEINDLYTDKQTKEQMIKFSQYTTAQSVIADVIGNKLCGHDTPLLIIRFNQDKIAYDGCSISSFHKQQSGDFILDSEDADLVSKILRSGSDKFKEIFHQNEIESLNHIIDDGNDQKLLHKSAIQLLEELSKPILETNFFIDKVKLKIKEDDLSKLKIDEKYNNNAPLQARLLTLQLIDKKVGEMEDITSQAQITEKYEKIERLKEYQNAIDTLRDKPDMPIVEIRSLLKDILPEKENQTSYQEQAKQTTTREGRMKYAENFIEAYKESLESENSIQIAQPLDDAVREVNDKKGKKKFLGDVIAIENGKPCFNEVHLGSPSPKFVSKSVKKTGIMHFLKSLLPRTKTATFKTPTLSQSLKDRINFDIDSFSYIDHLESVDYASELIFDKDGVMKSQNASIDIGQSELFNESIVDLDEKHTDLVAPLSEIDAHNKALKEPPFPYIRRLIRWFKNTFQSKRTITQTIQFKNPLLGGFAENAPKSGNLKSDLSRFTIFDKDKILTTGNINASKYESRFLQKITDDNNINLQTILKNCSAMDENHRNMPCIKLPVVEFDDNKMTINQRDYIFNISLDANEDLYETLTRYCKGVNHILSELRINGDYSPTELKNKQQQIINELLDTSMLPTDIFITTVDSKLTLTHDDNGYNLTRTTDLSSPVSAADADTIKNGFENSFEKDTWGYAIQSKTVDEAKALAESCNDTVNKLKTYLYIQNKCDENEKSSYKDKIMSEESSNNPEADQLKQFAEYMAAGDDEKSELLSNISKNLICSDIKEHLPKALQDHFKKEDYKQQSPTTQEGNETNNGFLGNITNRFTTHLNYFKSLIYSPDGNKENQDPNEGPSNN